ncbi:MAG TPA: histidine kinase, partial [Phnomibacter sp.]|nr:histidine kinase [Phnomibacter sp.]
QQSLQMARAHGLPRIVAAAYQNMGATYLQQQQYSQALPYYQQAFDSAHAIGYTKALLDAALQLSVCYQKTGQPLEALARFQQYAHLKDSIFSAEKTQRIEALQAAYENQRKEDEIERLQVQQQLATARQQRTYVAIVGLVLVLAATGLLLSQRLRRRRAEMEAEKMQLLSKANEEKRQLDLARMNSELSALKAQMNPHFLFNALNSVQDLFLTGNTQAANELLAKFSDLTRAVLDASGQRTIPLYEEIEILKNYLEIEKTRFADTLNYTFDVDPQIDLYQTEIPPMLVQPYVENAIKHGLLHLTANRKLQVLFTQEAPGQLLVTIEDNGVGRQQAARYNQMRQKKHQSFATSATEKRLQLLNSGRQQQIGVRYTDLAKANGSPAGTRVTLRIPIEGAADKE